MPDLASWSVDGLSPAALAEPETPEQLAVLLAGAAAQGGAAIPWGGGTRMGLGNPPVRFDLALSLARLHQVIEHYWENLTVTVQAGMPLAALQAHLRQHGQFLPLDPPRPDRATIGGIIASATAGLLQPGYGAPRNLVLGLRLALPSGEIISAGGKTVKNVAGYDMCKLFVGSLGTLGVIVEATLRTYPVAPAESSLLAEFTDTAFAWQVADQVVHSQMIPVSLELFSLNGGTALAARFHGPEEVCRAQADELAELCAGAQISRPEAEEAEQLWGQRRDFPASTAGTVARVAAPLAALAGLISEAVGLAEPSDVSLTWQAQPWAGTAWLALGEARGLAGVLGRLRALAQAQAGSLALERAGLELKRQFEAWGPAGDGLQLMRALKSSFDPGNCLNPGRFVGGI